MHTIELAILGLTYTALTISLFLQFICYSKKIENWETLALTLSLILLVISISLSPLQADKETTALSTLLCMILVACTTFLDTLSRQKHAINYNYKKLQIGIAIALALAAILTSKSGHLQSIQNLIVAFLLVSIVISMIIVHKTKVIKQYKHLENSNKWFAWTFLVIVPIYIFSHFVFSKGHTPIRMDFLLYAAFLAMAIAKIHDDLKRLSLVREEDSPNRQKFKNFGLTAREQEIATLLYDGLTYQNIADQLFISLPTVKTHASNIYKKCKVKNRNELTKLLIA